jgi:SAM-dependent methyltransferase
MLALVGLGENDGQLEAAIQWDGHAGKCRVGLAAGRVRRERLRVGEDVVRNDEPAGLEQRPRQREERLVVVLLGVQEHEVEDVSSLAQRREGVPFDELGPLLEPRIRDVPAPGCGLLGIVLERDEATAEYPSSRGQPDRRVAARAADLEHLDPRLCRREREEEAPGRPLHLARAPLARQAGPALGGVLGLEAGENCTHTIVEHGSSLLAWKTCLVRLRLRDFHAFLSTELPASPAHVLEIGCADGELSRALEADGYEVVAIDPAAPDGAPFQRVRLEEYGGEHEPFDAVVASLAMHHVPDLAGAVAKIARLLRPDGRLVLAEFAKERLAGRTARWYHAQRLALAAVGREDSAAPPEFERWHAKWLEDRADVHPAADLLAALSERFEQRRLEWTPYLFSYRLDDSLEPAERALIDAREIEAVGYRYVGEPRS